MNRSLATAQVSLAPDCDVRHPLFPVLVAGCPQTRVEGVPAPLELAFDEAGVNSEWFDQPASPGLERWAELLPPLQPGSSAGEGGTPVLLEPGLASWAGFEGELFIKDESRNPTWSHKDRLNLCTVSAAVHQGAPGVVAASSGNHGASAAAYAARAGLTACVLITPGTPPAVVSFLQSYGAAVFEVPRELRWSLLEAMVQKFGLHPVSNLTELHTGHPFGPEGYKTIAFELRVQLGLRAPGTVYVPTGYGELLFGVAKGFEILARHGKIERVPTIVACEPAARAPLARAIAEGKGAVSVPANPSAAYAIAVTHGGYRARVALERGRGRSVVLGEAELAAAQRAMASRGLWAEVSAAAGLAALRQEQAAGVEIADPVVVLSTSSGFKGRGVQHPKIVRPEPTLQAIADAAREHYGLRLE